MTVRDDSGPPVPKGDADAVPPRDSVRGRDAVGQRDAELAVLHEIGTALARQLAFDDIVELVGERVRQVFGVASLWIAIHDETSGTISFPYAVEADERAQMAPFAVGPGLTSRVLGTRQPVRFGTSAEGDALGAIAVGGVTESWVGVPILAGDHAIGVIALESFEQRAFDVADERLLATIASSMGVAPQPRRMG